MGTDSGPMVAAIRAFMAAEGLNQAEMAAKLGVSQNAISFWLRGMRSPKARLQPRIREVCGRYLPAVSTGIVAEPTMPYRTPRPTGAFASANGMEQRPILSRAFCHAKGVPYSRMDALTDGEVEDLETLWVERERVPVFLLRAEGDSMVPTIKPGDVLVVEELTPPTDLIGRAVVVVADDEHGNEDILCKRLVAINDGVTLDSDNPDHPRLTLPRERVRKIWRIRKSITVNP